jgi:hypothetical protein
MKCNYVLNLTVILVLVTSVSVFAQIDNTAQGQRAGRAGNMQMRSVGLLALTSLPQSNLLTGQNSTLNLTQEQKTAVTRLQANHRKTLAAIPEAAPGEERKSLSLQAAMEKASKELNAALTTRGVSADVLKLKIKACKEAEDAIVAINITYWAKLRDILTDEQLQQLFVALTTRPARSPGAGQGGQGGGGRRNNNNNTSDTQDAQ